MSHELPVTSSPSTAEDSFHALVVDSNAVHCKVMCKLLQRLGCADAATAATPDEAISLLRSAELKRPHVIFMSVSLSPSPEKVYDAARKMRSGLMGREFDWLASVPIVALGHPNVHLCEQRCSRAGMDDFITKPLRLWDLVCVVRKWCFGEDVAALALEAAG
ncbi:CheY-like superfamily [Sphaerosporella brunnea]|uniref:CheY-like superfamily n=1 Tax=Sphaerosporella brunnea TaxID=1250544 RepID=A0A5J5EH54_9PEZI|nr:CheY-like superfamily [Sphaerosporella brunnea]